MAESNAKRSRGDGNLATRVAKAVRESTERWAGGARRMSKRSGRKRISNRKRISKTEELKGGEEEEENGVVQSVGPAPGLEEWGFWADGEVDGGVD
eukprot:3540287-Rhodomonas_salina.2